MIRKPKKKKHLPYVNLSELYVESILLEQEEFDPNQMQLPDIEPEQPPATTQQPVVQQPEPKQPTTTQFKLEATNPYNALLLRIYNTPERQQELFSVDGIALPAHSSLINIPLKDIKIWEDLYKIRSPKKDTKDKSKKDQGESAGSGKGEIALYWFMYVYVCKTEGQQAAEQKVRDNRDATSGAPDLIANGRYVETKSYDKEIGLMTIGKFSTAGSEQEQDINNRLLSTVISFKILFSLVDNSNVKEVVSEYIIKSLYEKTIPGTGNFNGADIVQSFDVIKKLAEIIKHKKFEDMVKVWGWNSLRGLITNFAFVEEQIGGDIIKLTSEQCAKKLLARIVKAKLGDKPGNGSYVVNVTPNGQGTAWFLVNLDLVDRLESSDVSASNSELKINFNKIFGPLSTPSQRVLKSPAIKKAAGLDTRKQYAPEV